MSNTVFSQGELGDFFELRHGFAFPGSAFSDRGELLVVKIKNIKPGRLDLSKQEFIPADYLATHGGYMPKAGDLLVSLSGNRYEGNPETWVGKVCLYAGTPRCLINQRVGILRKKEGVEIDSRYFSYLLSTLDAQQSLIQIATSSGGQANLSTKQLLDFEVLVAPPADQKAIAHILGTLDDKIELNRKINETLEAMAKALFKSWFTDFDPVRAKVEGRPTGLPAEISDLFPDSFEDSELGEIPSGWNVAELGDISTISGGKQLESVELKSKGRFPVYGANGTMGFHDLATHNSFVIVFGRVGAYCGSINWEYGGAWVNNNASSVIPLRYNELVLQWMLEADYSNYRTGSAQPFIPNGALACSPVLMPTDALASVFCDLLLPIRLKQKKNQSAALSLAEIRDALLPKLISGEIRIPDAEKMLEEVDV